MIIEDKKQFFTKTEGTALLGIDYGTQRIGLAISDSMQIIASPYKTIHKIDNHIQSIIQILQDKNIGGIIIGLPLNMDNSISQQAKITAKFANTLDHILNHKSLIIFHDERLSSQEADDFLQFGNIKKKNFKKINDQIAASIILNSFLNSK